MLCRQRATDHLFKRDRASILSLGTGKCSEPRQPYWDCTGQIEVSCVSCNNGNHWKIHGGEKHTFPGWRKIEGLEPRKNIILEGKSFLASMNKSLTRQPPFLFFPLFWSWQIVWFGRKLEAPWQDCLPGTADKWGGCVNFSWRCLLGSHMTLL